VPNANLYHHNLALTTAMDYIHFICATCDQPNSKQCKDEHTEGYEVLCDVCNENNIICRFEGCKKVFGPKYGASFNKKPWTYFLSHHFRYHEHKWRKRKADNDLQPQSHIAVSVSSVRESTDDNINDAVEEETQPGNQSNDSEVQAVMEESNDAMEHEMSDEIDLGDANADMDSLDNFQADCFAVKMQEEVIEEMPPDLEDRTASLDDSLPLTVMKL
jgi:hypothetical protein